MSSRYSIRTTLLALMLSVTSTILARVIRRLNGRPLRQIIPRHATLLAQQERHNVAIMKSIRNNNVLIAKIHHNITVT